MDNQPRHLTTKGGETMKIKGIADVCKEREGAVILEKYDQQGELQRQFIMTVNGQALYPIDGMPQIDENTILTIFDIPKDKRSGWEVRREALEPDRLKRVLADYDDSDRDVKLEGITIAHKGDMLVPFLTQYGAVFIRADYLKPIKDERKSLEFWAREITPGSPPILIAKVGMQLVAAIASMVITDQDFTDALDALVYACKRAIERKAREEAERDQAAEGTNDETKD